MQEITADVPVRHVLAREGSSFLRRAEAEPHCFSSPNGFDHPSRSTGFSSLPNDPMLQMHKYSAAPPLLQCLHITQELLLSQPAVPGCPAWGRLPVTPAAAQSIEFLLNNCSSSGDLAAQESVGLGSSPASGQATRAGQCSRGHALAITRQDNFHTPPPLLPCLLTPRLFLPLGVFTLWLKA